MSYWDYKRLPDDWRLIQGTSLRGTLLDAKQPMLTARQLERAFGPSDAPEGDGKVQRKWAFERRGDSAVFTLYSYKTCLPGTDTRGPLDPDEPYDWHIGGAEEPTGAEWRAFARWVDERVRSVR